jgi:phage tail sheath gpL-like
MTISFTQIPSTVGVPGPYVEFDPTGARTTQAGKPYKLFVYGQMSSAKPGNVNGSTAAANVPVQVQSIGAAIALFGPASPLVHMLTGMFKLNSVTELWVIPQLDDAAGVARALTVSYTGAYGVAAAVPGVEKVYIGDRVYAVAVVIGDTATAVAAKMMAVINADTGALFTASVVAGLMTLTAKSKGECANDVQVVTQYDIGDVSPSGSFAAVAQTVAGATNPSVAASIASASTMYMTHVVLPYNDTINYALMLAEAQDRWGPLPSSTSLGNGQDDFLVFCGFRGTEGQINAFMAAGRNSEYFSPLGIEPAQTISGVQYGGLMSTAWQAAACYAATSARLASAVANNPHQNVVMSCLKPAPVVCRFPWNVRNRLILNYGVATYKYNDSNQVMLETAITERITTDSGAPTDAERRVETQLAKSYIRWSVRAMLDATYPANRLADDGNPDLPNNVATPKMIKGSILSLCKNVWVPLGIVENFAAFKASLVVERSTEDCNTIKFQLMPDLVNILTVKAGKISYIVC